MKKRKGITAKVFTFTIISVLVFSLFSVTVFPFSQVTGAEAGSPSSVKISVDKGCGGRYKNGESLTILFEVTSPESKALVTIYWYTPHGRKKTVANYVYSTNEEHSLFAYAECPAGHHTLEIYAANPPAEGTGQPLVQVTNYTEIEKVSDTCFFYVDPPCEAPDADYDKDGYYPPEDCNDNNPKINPGAYEVCDGIDNDCDGEVDEICFVCSTDNDHDGYNACNDCNDFDMSVHPRAPEMCDGKDNDCDGEIDEDCAVCEDDNDGDGYPSCKDCNDYNTSVYPNAPEVCDGEDNNCDGEVDEGCPVCFIDNDNDGFTSCFDCNDFYPYAYPGAPEFCDGRDNDCDGLVDEGLQCDSVKLWIGRGCGAQYTDGEEVRIFFKVSSTALAATITVTNYPPRGESHTLVADRVFDTNRIHSLSTTAQCPEGVVILIITVKVIIDGKTVILIDYCAFHVIHCRVFDSDDDGYMSPSEGGTDCNDNDSSIHPGAQEICDGKDNDCNGLIDEGGDCEYAEIWIDRECGANYNDEEPLEVYFRVSSSVSHAEVTITHFPAKGSPEFLIMERTFETNKDYHFPVFAVCPEGMHTLVITAEVLIEGKPKILTDDCTFRVIQCRPLDSDGDGYVSIPKGGDDCDDSDSSAYPGAPEVCDGKDNNCDGEVDEGFDTDQDGYTVCGGDCNDTDSTINPGAKEICNDGVDNDCDGLIDETADKDNDGYVSVECGGSDCNDNNSTVYPGAPEICDGKDNNCNGEIDERDMDKDGSVSTECGGDDCDDNDFNTYPGSKEVCDGKDNNCNGEVDEGFDTDQDGYTACEGDCDDNDSSIYPGAEEICDDGKDNDCDGLIDETGDKDNDWYKSPQCGGNDCDDTDPAVNPGAREVCDGKDNDCDGEIDEASDRDQDGYTPCEGDCDDDDPNTNPDAVEICDGKDNNCNGGIDEGFPDNDQDGYTECGGDCDDSDPAVNPGMEEVQDGMDNDCDGEVDEVEEVGEEDTSQQNSIFVSVKSKCGNPISQAEIFLDGEYKGKSNMRGELQILNVEKGNHTISAKKEENNYYEDIQSIDVNGETTIMLVLVSTDFTLCFSGNEWYLRDSENQKEPPPSESHIRPEGDTGNYFSSDNVRIDEDGLHLFIENRDGNWYCAEVFTKEPLWFGKYVFYIEGRIDELDPNVVFSMFNYWKEGERIDSDEYWNEINHKGTNEIDIEFSSWGDRDKECPGWWPQWLPSVWPFCKTLNSQYVVWPSVTGGYKDQYKFTTALDQNLTTHIFDWQKDMVSFLSLHDHSSSPLSPDYIIHEHTYGGSYIPQNPLWVHINLWLYGNSLSDERVEIIIKGFEFTESTHESIHLHRSLYSLTHTTPKTKFNFTLSIPFSNRLYASISEDLSRFFRFHDSVLNFH